MKKTAMITLLMVLVSTFAYAGGAINEEGYLKDKGRNRIFTFSYKKGVSGLEIMRHAENLMNTPHRMTAAYYYSEGSTIPADGITLAKTIFRANYVLYDVPGLSKWDYAFMRGYNGSTRFINCMLEPTDDLCRQK